MLKHIFAFLIFTIVTAQSFASGITATNGVAQPSICNESTLGTSTGSVELVAEFVPQTINLNWYNDDTRINVSNPSNTCTYGTAISLPTTPEKPGYTFKGWKILQYDFSTFDTSINGEHRYGRGVDTSNDTDTCYYDETLITCNADFADLGRHQWKTPFNYGTIYGDAMCSTVPGFYAVAGSPLNDSGQNCWCKATGYLNNDIVYSPNSPLSWVIRVDYGSASLCASNCAASCANYVRKAADFRRAVFGQSGN